MATEHVLHMQKALDQMNLQIHRVLSDITGLSGLGYWTPSWLANEIRDLSWLCHGGVKSSGDTIARSLVGDYRPEHLFALRQSLAAFHYYQQPVVEVARRFNVNSGSEDSDNRGANSTQTNQGSRISTAPV